MTLVYRLCIAFLIGAILAFGTYKLLWRAPSLDGSYSLQTGGKNYSLKIKGDSALMMYEDKKKRKYAYRGILIFNAQQSLIRWTEQHNKGEWDTLPQPIDDKFAIEGNSVHTAEGIFTANK